VVQLQGCVLPIEEKAAENLQAKSLKLFLEKFALERGVRTSLSNFRVDGKLCNVPLYLIEQLEGLACGAD